MGFLRNIFGDSSESVLISRQVISLEDNDFGSDTVFYSGEGDCVRRVRTTDELMEEHSFLIELIKNRAASADCFIDYEVEILPVLRRFISIVSVSPADHTLSSVFSTQLIKQALMGIIKFSEIYSKSSLALATGPQNFFECFYLMLSLSIYRFYQRFKITTPGRNYEFKLLKHDNLEEFIKIHRATHLRFFLKREDNNEEISFDESFMHLISKCPQSFECLRKSPQYLKLRNLTLELGFTKDELRFNSLEKKPEIDSLFLLENNIKNMMLKADEISSYLCAHEGGFLIDLGVYLRRFLGSGIISEKTEGAFILPNGFVIEEGSLAHNLIYRAIERYYTDLNFYADFNENLKKIDLKTEFSEQKLTDFNLEDTDGRKKDFYNLVLNSEYLFSCLYKRKSRWISLLKNRKTYLVKGFEIYFPHNFRALTAEPYNVVELRSMSDPEPMLRTLRCITIRPYDPTYIEFKPLKGPLHYCFLGEPLDTLIEADKIRFGVIPHENLQKNIRNDVENEKNTVITESMLDENSIPDNSDDKNSDNRENSTKNTGKTSKTTRKTLKPTENDDSSLNTELADTTSAKTDSSKRSTRRKSAASKSSKKALKEGVSEVDTFKALIDAADSNCTKSEDSEVMAEVPDPDVTSSSSDLSAEELCDLEKALISNFNQENSIDADA